MAFVEGSGRSGVATGGELEPLLRSRLRAAALIMLVPFVYYFFKHWADPIPGFEGDSFLQSAHILFIVLTIAASGLLWSKVPVTLRELRLIEFGLFGMTAGFFGLMQYFIFCIEQVCA